MEIQMALPEMENFSQILAKFIERDNRAFARRCRKTWPKSAREMADELSAYGYPLSERKCNSIRNGEDGIKARDVRAINYIIARKKADEKRNEIARIKARIAQLESLDS